MKATIYGMLILISMGFCQNSKALTERPQVQRSILNWGVNASSDKQDSYEISVDSNTSYKGHPSAWLRSRTPNPKGFCAIDQTFSAQSYRGKRMQVTANVKTLDVNEWAGLWMLVDGPDGVTAFDNMDNRPIKGSSDWKQYTIILDVPRDSTKIKFGFMLTCSGNAWINGFTFEPVDNTIETTGKAIDHRLLPKETLQDSPRNLDFEQSRN